LLAVTGKSQIIPQKNFKTFAKSQIPNCCPKSSSHISNQISNLS